MILPCPYLVRGVNIREYVKSLRFSSFGVGGGFHDSCTELEVILSTKTSKGADKSKKQMLKSKSELCIYFNKMSITRIYK